MPHAACFGADGAHSYRIFLQVYVAPGELTHFSRTHARKRENRNGGQTCAQPGRACPANTCRSVSRLFHGVCNAVADPFYWGVKSYFNDGTVMPCEAIHFFQHSRTSGMWSQAVRLIMRSILFSPSSPVFFLKPIPKAQNARNLPVLETFGAPQTFWVKS